MAETIEGEVVKAGRPKPYDNGFDSQLKKFIEVEADDGQRYKTMVHLEDEDDRPAWNYEGVGDRVRYTVQRFKDEDDDGAIWTTGCTKKRDFERLTTAGEDHYNEVKEKERKEREEERKRKEEERKKKREREKKRKEKERQERLENERNDPRLTDAIRERISKTFDLKRIRALLEDIAMNPGIKEGTGGKKKMSKGDDYKVGTGLRHPTHALYDMPENWRQSILDKAMESGLIVKEEDGGYSITIHGARILVKIDRCPECGAMRKPFKVDYYQKTSERSGYKGKFISWECPDHGSNANLDKSADQSHKRSVVQLDLPEKVKDQLAEVLTVEVPDYIKEDGEENNDRKSEDGGSPPECDLCHAEDGVKTVMRKGFDGLPAQYDLCKDCRDEF